MLLVIVLLVVGLYGICYLLSVCAHLPSHQRNSHEILWYGIFRAGSVAIIIIVGPLGRVGQRLLLRVVSLAPSQILSGLI